MTIRRKHRHSAMPPLCKGRWQKSSIFDGGVADTGYGANFDTSIPQSALRPTAPFTQGSQCAGRTCGAPPVPLEEIRSLSTSSGERSSPPSPRGEGLERRKDTQCTIGAAGGNHDLSTSSGERSSPPSPQGEGIALRRCLITTEAGLAPSGSPAAQILSNDAHPPRGEGQGA